MKRLALTLLGMALMTVAHAQLFVDSFDPPSITPRFPLVAGQYQLPPGPAVN